MKCFWHRARRNLFTTLVVGASTTWSVALAQDSGSPSQLPPSIPETAPAPHADITASARGRELHVPLGGSIPLQMTGAKPIRTVYNRQEGVAVVAPTSDRSKVLVTGKQAGTSNITLTAEDQSREMIDVVVEPDMQYLKGVLRRVVPTANLEIIPATGGTIIIGGTVVRAEDVDLVLNTTAGILGKKDGIINAMHVGGVQQVQIDVVIATVDRTKFRNLAVEFSSQGVVHSFVSTFSGGASTALSQASAGAATAATSVAGGSASFTPPAIGTNANIVTGLVNVGDGQTILGFLTALKGESVTKLLAEPRVVVASGHVGHFYSGGEQAIPQLAGGSGAATAGVNLVPFGTTVEVLPIVMGDGKILLDIDPKVDNPSTNTVLGAPIPGTNTQVAGRTGQEVHTTVVMEDGQTYVLAGLIQRTMDANIQKWPILGDCPFIGVLFSSKTFTESEQELVILVTPHLVDAASCCQLPKYLPGEETRSADDFELFYEGILEAPRGPREVFPHGIYRPAYQSQPACPAASPVPVSGAGGCSPVGASADALRISATATVPASVTPGPAAQPTTSTTAVVPPRGL